MGDQDQAPLFHQREKFDQLLMRVKRQNWWANKEAKTKL